MWIPLDIVVKIYRSGTVNSNTVNSKLYLIQSFYEVSVNSFAIISCLKYTVNSNFHLIWGKTLPMNDFELTVLDLYKKLTCDHLPCDHVTYPMMHLVSHPPLVEQSEWHTPVKTQPSLASLHGR